MSHLTHTIYTRVYVSLRISRPPKNESCHCNMLTTFLWWLWFPRTDYCILCRLLCQKVSVSSFSKYPCPHNLLTSLHPLYNIICPCPSGSTSCFLPIKLPSRTSKALRPLEPLLTCPAYASFCFTIFFLKCNFSSSIECNFLCISLYITTICVHVTTVDICRPLQTRIFRLPAAGLARADGISARWTAWGSQQD